MDVYKVVPAYAALVSALGTPSACIRFLCGERGQRRGHQEVCRWPATGNSRMFLPMCLLLHKSLVNSRIFPPVCLHFHKSIVNSLMFSPMCLLFHKPFVNSRIFSPMCLLPHKSLLVLVNNLGQHYIQPVCNACRSMSLIRTVQQWHGAPIVDVSFGFCVFRN